MAIGNLREIIPAFFTGPNGEPLTPDQIAQRQQVAQSLMQQASDTSPNAGGWASILAKGLQGGVSAYQRGRADDAAALNAKNDQANIEAGLGSIFGGGGQTPAGGIGGAFPSAVSQGSFPSAVAQVASPTSGVATGTGVSLPGNLGSIINDAASRYNVDPAAMSVIAQIESGGNVNAKNPNSSAGGPFQFIDSTAKQYGLKDRFDPVQASDAAARLTRDNAAVLTKALGRAPTAGELYLAHQQGSGGASKLLSNPNARAVDIVGRDAVRLNGGDENMTALSFANKWINKADRLMGTPQQAIQSIAPIEQGDENPAAGIAPIAQAGNAYVDPIVAANPYQEAGQVAPMAMTAEAQAPQQPQIDPRLAALNDQMLGGAFSPTGRNEVAQALTGYFPDAPSANRAPITAQNNAMSQAPMQQQTGGVNPQIIASLLGPNSSPQARQVGALLIGQHQRQQAAMQAQQQAQQEIAQRQQLAQSMGIDPNAAMDAEAWKAAVAKANRDRSTVTVGNTVLDANTMQPIYEGTPENPTSVQEYEYGVRTPGYFERQESLKKAGATNIDNRQMGAVPAGYQVQYDDQGRPVSMAPIPGSPDDIKNKAAIDAAGASKDSKRQIAEVVTQDIDRAMDLIENSPFSTTGVAGSAISRIGGTSANDVANLINTIQANAGFDRLQAMRDASPTGGALGSISERELTYLQSTIGSLEQSQSKEQLIRNLKRVKRAYSDIIDGPISGDNVPISEMTDEELEALANGN